MECPLCRYLHAEASSHELGLCLECEGSSGARTLDVIQDGQSSREHTHESCFAFRPWAQGDTRGPATFELRPTDTRGWPVKACRCARAQKLAVRCVEKAVVVLNVRPALVSVRRGRALACVSVLLLLEKRVVESGHGGLRHGCTQALYACKASRKRVNVFV